MTPLSFVFPSQGERPTTVMPWDHPFPGWVRSQSSEVMELVPSKFFPLWPVTFHCFLMAWSFGKAELGRANYILYKNNFRKVCHCSFLWPSHEIWFFFVVVVVCNITAYKGTNDSQLSKKKVNYYSTNPVVCSLLIVKVTYCCGWLLSFCVVWKHVPGGHSGCLLLG